MSETISVSLVSHTNVGKTTLARTLLRRDVGEVIDQAHVTLENERHLLIETSGQDRLVLWDTPGFGNTVRLLRRLRQQSNPILWMLTQAWDRFTDRSLWCSREAVRNMKEESDVVLYLLNASEDPVASGYVAAEAEILEWIGKPVLVLLNQTGSPATPEDVSRVENRWQAFVDSRPVLRGCLTLDAFTRCWVEERSLLERVSDVLPEARRSAMSRIIEAWSGKNLAIFEGSIEILARFVAEAASDRELLSKSLPRPLAARRARRQIRTRFRNALSAANAHLLRLHDLPGAAAKRFEERFEDLSDPGEPIGPETVAAAGILAAVASGAATGVVADLAGGGLTFGAGFVLGAMGGGISGAAAAWGFGKAFGQDEAPIRWTPDSLDRQIRAACLRYLAIAHFGRGAGDYQERECPDFWRSAVDVSVEMRREALAKAWEAARAEDRVAATRNAAQHLRSVFRDVLREALVRFYPRAESIFPSSSR